MIPKAGWLGPDGTFLPPKVGKTTPVKIEKIRLFLSLGAHKVEDAIHAAETLRKVLRQVQKDRIRHMGLGR